MMNLKRNLLSALALALLDMVLIPIVLSAQVPITTGDMNAFHPRAIGPAVTGGRVHDVEAVPGNPSTIYVATASGGLWRSVNRGQTWKNVFDTMAVSTFGDVALAPSNPEIIYAGTGEQQNRQSTSYGNGIYRSDDSGETWRHLGLEETRHIGRIVIHPVDPDIAYVGALGNLWSGSESRGVYKTTNGGLTWENVLFVNEYTGVVDMVMDPDNPNTLYAAMYQRLRRAWGFNGGGPGSGIYKTTDGGSTWNELQAGLPEGDKGRIGLAISASNSRVLNALVEHADPNLQGTYRSENGGMTWERVNSLDSRPMYYSHIFIDPNDEDRVYSLATQSNVSRDGGRTFTQIAVAPTYDVGIHADHHTLWIDPSDSEHLYLAGDAGLHESYDGGVSFRKMNNFPIAQFYAIDVDMRDPYWVYGGLQDNHSFMGPSETRRWIGIVNDDWKQNGFGDGMYWQADPRDARYSYGSSNGGSYFRYDTRTGDMHDISPIEPLGEEYRFDWTSPMMLSQHDPDVLYVAGNRLFISQDQGETWEHTEDLSRGIDRDELELMGVLGADISISRNDGTSSFGEAVTLDESPLDPAVLWVGFDDGNLQVSRDAGKSWEEVSGNISGITDGTYVSRITASWSTPGTAYATFDGHRDGDFRPYVYRTEDFGGSWEPLHAELPELGVANVIAEHPNNQDVLFLGTEHAVFVSTDKGHGWAKIPNLPTTHYDDLLIHPREQDLVLGTHGRGIWILDDTRPFVEWAEAPAEVSVFSAGRGTIMVYRKDTSYRGHAEFAGTNPVDGIEITYRLGSGSGTARMMVTDVMGHPVREMQVPSSEGTHRVNWDLRHSIPGAVDRWERFSDSELARSIDERGPWVSPGSYTVTVEARGSTASTVVEVRGDPAMPITVSMYQSRERFMLEALALTNEIQAYMREQGMTGGGRRGGRGGRGSFRGSGAPTTPQAKLAAAARMVQQVYQALNGGAVRPGTLYPPTRSQRDAVNNAKALFSEVKAGMEP